MINIFHRQSPIHQINRNTPAKTQFLESKKPYSINIYMSKDAPQVLQPSLSPLPLTQELHSYSIKPGE